MSELPEGWATATLKDLIGSNGLLTDGDWILSEHLKTGNDVRLIQLADVGVGRFLNKSSKSISQKTANEIGVTYLREDDVLISRMAHPLARACLFPALNQPCITAVDVAIARSDETVSLPKFIMHLCNTHHVLNQAEAVAVGTTRKRISRKNLEQIFIPLPPLNEQRRIAAKLETLLSRVDMAQARLATILRILKRFRQSVLAAACSGRLTADWREEQTDLESASDLIKRILDERRSERKTEQVESFKSRVIQPKHATKEISALDDDDALNLPEGWILTTLETIAEVIDPNPSHRMPKYVENGIPYVSSENFVDGDTIDFSFGRRVSAQTLAEQKARFTVNDGDFALSRIGTIGKTRFLHVEQKYCLSYALVVIKGITRNIDSRYLRLVVSSDALIGQARAGVQSVGVPDLGIGKIRAFKIAVSSLAEQQEIVRRVEALFKTADSLEARYRTAKAHVDQLTQSILAKAFRGELVYQDPNDEPASVLLARISHAGAQSERKPKRPRNQAAPAAPLK